MAGVTRHGCHAWLTSDQITGTGSLTVTSCRRVLPSNQGLAQHGRSRPPDLLPLALLRLLLVFFGGGPSTRLVPEAAPTHRIGGHRQRARGSGSTSQLCGSLVLLRNIEPLSERFNSRRYSVFQEFKPSGGTKSESELASTR